MSNPGQVFLVRNWDHNTPNAKFGFSLGRAKKGRVAVMVYLGEQAQDPKTEAEVIDIDAVMLGLGFKRIRPAKAPQTSHPDTK